MSKQTETLKLALEALITASGHVNNDAFVKVMMARDALVEALAQPAQQQEPVAVVSGYYAGNCVILPTNRATIFNSGTALYTSPPAQQQEPVAWATQMGAYAHIHWGAKRPEYPVVYEVPLYTFPPAQRKPLTDEQFDKAGMKLAECMDYPWEQMPEEGKRNMRDHAKAIIEAAHGIKENT